MISVILWHICSIFEQLLEQVPSQGLFQPSCIGVAEPNMCLQTIAWKRLAGTEMTRSKFLLWHLLSHDAGQINESSVLLTWGRGLW